MAKIPKHDFNYPGSDRPRKPRLEVRRLRAAGVLTLPLTSAPRQVERACLLNMAQARANAAGEVPRVVSITQSVENILAPSLGARTLVLPIPVTLLFDGFRGAMRFTNRKKGCAKVGDAGAVRSDLRRAARRGAELQGVLSPGLGPRSFGASIQ